MHIWTESFYDPGDSEIQENIRLEDVLPLFGVINAHSEPHSPNHPLKEYQGKTSGQLICDEAVRFIRSNRHRKDMSLKMLVGMLNLNIGHAKAEKKISAKSDDWLSGAAFLIGRVDCNREVVEIAQGGDCYAIAVYKSGNIKIIWDSNFLPVEGKLRRKKARIMKTPEVAGDEGKMWDEFYPYLCESRQLANSTYVILDGQTAFSDLLKIRTLPLEDLAMVISFTDGMIPWSENPAWETWTRKIIANIKEHNGFQHVLGWTGQQENEAHAEASCQILHLND